jgi:hypothetical protein
MRQFVRDDQYLVKVSPHESLLLELRGRETALQCLGTRYWTLLTAAGDAPDFITCDHPVILTFKDPNRRGLCGYGLSETEVWFPLNPRQVLLGVFEDPPATLKVDVEAEQVASINSRTVYHAYRQVYSKTASVAVWSRGGISPLR